MSIVYNLCYSLNGWLQTLESILVAWVGHIKSSVHRQSFSVETESYNLLFIIIHLTKNIWQTKANNSWWKAVEFPWTLILSSVLQAICLSIPYSTVFLHWGPISLTLCLASVKSDHRAHIDPVPWIAVGSFSGAW